MKPAQKRRNAWIAASIVGAPLLWSIPTFFYLKAETQNKNATCQANLKTLNAAIQSFAGAHQNRLPNAQQWKTIVENQSSKTLHCLADPVAGRPCSYAMNANLSGKKLHEIKDLHDIILVYETNSKSAAPISDGKDMADVGKPETGQGRHNRIGYRFNYFLMADGAVRSPQNLSEVKIYRWR